MSNFGNVHKQKLQREKRCEEIRMLQQALALAATPSTAAVALAETSEMVPYDAKALDKQLVAHAGNRVEDQIRLLRGLHRLQTRDMRIANEQAEEFQQHMQNGDVESLAIDFSKMELDNASLRTLKVGNAIDVWIHRDISEFTTQPLAKEEPEALEDCIKLGSNERRMLSSKGLPDPGPIPYAC